MRRSAKLSAVIGVLLLGAWPLSAVAQGEPSIEITSPSDGDTVEGPEVTIEVEVENFELVEAGSEPAEGEGHVHFIVDGDEPEAGDTVGDDATHLGAEPFDTRDVELEPGEHTVIAVLGNAAHEVLDPVVSDEVTFTVEEAEEEDGAEEERPTRPADTGDGSLAPSTTGIGWLLFAGLGLSALAARYVVRRR